MVPASKRGNRLLWLLGRVQPRTCPGQHLVNDSFVGVAGWLRSARGGHVSHWLGCRKIPCQQQNRCLGCAKPVLVAYRDRPPVLCCFLPCVGLRHHLNVSRCRVALANPLPYRVTWAVPPVQGGSGGSLQLRATGCASARTSGSQLQLCTNVTWSRRKQGGCTRYCVVCRGHGGTCQVDAGTSADADEMVIAVSRNGCVL